MVDLRYGMIYFFKKQQKTFKPAKSHNAPQRKTLSKFAQKAVMATLGNSDGMKSAVKLPEGESMNEWLAVNTVDFFNEISLMYGTVLEDCTEQGCPVMSAGEYTYRWADGVKVKKPIECSAPKYIELLFEWVEAQINDETQFPLADDAEFPKNFKKNVATIFKRYFRVYAHVYHSHIKKVTSIGAEAHLNTCFKHFLFFIQEFNLVADNEMEPLAPLIARLTGAPPAGGDEGKEE